MFSRFVFGIFFVAGMVSSITMAFAGKMELTTYYPAPNGEYSTVKASTTLKVPVKTVGSDTAKVTSGEIWVEA